jgi:hypothetical protein
METDSFISLQTYYRKITLRSFVCLNMTLNYQRPENGENFHQFTEYNTQSVLNFLHIQRYIGTVGALSSENRI